MHKTFSVVIIDRSMYRYLVDDFLIQFCEDLKVEDFVVKSEWASGKKDRKGKREYLSDAKTGEMLKRLNRYLEGMVELPRIRIGKRQTIETLISEEALLLGKFLRDEKITWVPRIDRFIMLQILQKNRKGGKDFRFKV